MQISPLKISDSAFTLIEIMLVLGLLAMLVSLVMPRFGDNTSEVRKTLRYFLALSKNLKSMSSLKNQSYRIVFDLKSEERKDLNKTQEYWVERSNQKTLSSLFEKKQNESSLFVLDSSITKKKTKLPKGLRINFIEFPNQKTKIESGISYLYFLPQGYTEEALLSLSYKQTKNWTLYLHPVTSMIYLFDEIKNIKELRDR